MILQKISFTNFRNFKKAAFEFNPLLTIIIGENAKGKTNLLEGVYFLINGYGFRESKEEQLVNFDATNLSVEGIFGSNDHQEKFNIIILKDQDSLKKAFFINRTKKRLIDYYQNQTRAVLFTPEQIELIIGTPDKRRSYFNELLSFYDIEYKRKLKNYETALRKRNKILETYQNIESLQESLEFWNSYLVEHADYISKQREEYVEYLNSHHKLDHKTFEIDYLKNELSKERLSEYFDKESRVRRTLIGPQKDDFKISINSKNAHFYGSRSEQRFSVLWLKINEVLFYEEKFKRKPLLLLDDIFSELDMNNKRLVIELIERYQTIATTTEKEVLDLVKVPKSIINL